MKLFLSIVLAVFFLSAAAPVFAAVENRTKEAGNSSSEEKGTPHVLDAVVLYVPNRLLDILDMFSLNIGVGQTVRADLHVTEALKIGGGVDYFNAKLVKDANRQYGWVIQDGVDFAMGPFRFEDVHRKNASAWVREYYRNKEGVPSQDEEIFAQNTGARDFWAVGGSLGLGVIEADVDIHPLEWIDAVLGFLLIDIKGDDLTFEDFM